MEGVGPPEWGRMWRGEAVEGRCLVSLSPSHPSPLESETREPSPPAAPEKLNPGLSAPYIQTGTAPYPPSAPQAEAMGARAL